MDYWTNFAKYLNPNGLGKPSSTLTHWPAFEVPEKKYMVFNTLNSTQSDPNAEACEIWDSIGYNFSNPWMRSKE
jgi:carboxylesterase type B